MYSRYIFLIALFCSPMVGLTQQEAGTNGGLRPLKTEVGVLVDSIRSRQNPHRSGGRMFDTFPMANTYQQSSTAAMPNAYRDDNCVPMPNVYQGNPPERIIKVKLDSASNFKADSLLLRELDKLRDTLEKPKPKE